VEEQASGREEPVSRQGGRRTSVMYAVPALLDKLRELEVFCLIGIGELWDLLFDLLREEK
jgi:hypothetical protein